MSSFESEERRWANISPHFPPFVPFVQRQLLFSFYLSRFRRMFPPQYSFLTYEYILPMLLPSVMFWYLFLFYFMLYFLLKSIHGCHFSL
jgi:hypothetical protein